MLWQECNIRDEVDNKEAQSQLKGPQASGQEIGTDGIAYSCCCLESTFSAKHLFTVAYVFQCYTGKRSVDGTKVALA